MVAIKAMIEKPPFQDQAAALITKCHRAFHFSSYKHRKGVGLMHFVILRHGSLVERKVFSNGASHWFGQPRSATLSFVSSDEGDQSGSKKSFKIGG